MCTSNDPMTRIEDKVTDINTALQLLVAEFKHRKETCYKVVMGNSEKPIATRVDSLEDKANQQRKGFWVLVGCVLSIIAGILVSLVK